MPWAPKLKGSIVIQLAVLNRKILSQTLAIHQKSSVQAYEFVEIFCGKAWVSRVMRCSGHTTAQMDILMSDADQLSSPQNPMDLLTPAGFLFFVWILLALERFGKNSLCQFEAHHFLSSGLTVLILQFRNWCISLDWLILRLALTCILNAKMDHHLCVLAMVCTTFVAINKGTNKREPWSPLGNTLVPSVAKGNILAARSPVAGFGREVLGCLSHTGFGGVNPQNPKMIPKVHIQSSCYFSVYRNMCINQHGPQIVLTWVDQWTWTHSHVISSPFFQLSTDSSSPQQKPQGLVGV